MFRLSCLCSLLCYVSGVFAHGSIQVKGVYGVPEEATFKWTFERIIDNYLPFNPVIIEANGCKGDDSNVIAHRFRLGQVFVFEPDWANFNQILLNTQELENIYVRNVDFNTCNMSDWCQNQGIHSVDLIRLVTKDFGLQMLKGSKEILTTVSVVSVRVDFSSDANKRKFKKLVQFLEQSGFVLLSLWNHQKSWGEGVFIRKEIFDAIYS